MTKFIWSEKLAKRKSKLLKNAFLIVDSRLTLDANDYWFSDNNYVVDLKKQSNNLKTFSEIITTMFKRKMDKTTTLIAVGGREIHDLAGFISATYLRGIRWIYVPTTLTAMVDCCIGGRCGLDEGDKDCAIGSNHPPCSVILDLSFLKELSDEEWSSGVCEIIRTAINDQRAFTYLEQTVIDLKSRNEQTVRECVNMVRSIKKKMLRNHAMKTGRSSLKIGRTIGLALERDDKAKRGRGEYLLLGMLLEMSVLKEYIDAKYYVRVLSLIDKTELKPLGFSVESVVNNCFQHTNLGIVTLAVPSKCGVIEVKKMDEATVLSRLDAYKTE